MVQKLIDIEINNQLLTISGAISLKLQVASEFEYIGTQEIIIYNNAKVFHYVFANYFTNEKQERAIYRLFFLQHEYFLPEIDKTYEYSSKNIVNLGDILWQRDSFIDQTSDYESEPKSDAYQLMTFVEKNNFKLPSKILINRLVTMLNEEKNQELLLLYFEEVTEDKYKQLISNEKIVEEQWEEEKIHLQKKALSAFKIL